MKWPLHPIAPSTEALINALPVNSPIAGTQGFATLLDDVASGVSGHAAGVPVAAEPAPLPGVR